MASDDDDDAAFYAGDFRHVLHVKFQMSLPALRPTHVPRSQTCIVEVECLLADFHFSRTAIVFSCNEFVALNDSGFRLPYVDSVNILGSQLCRSRSCRTPFFGLGCEVTYSGKFIVYGWSSDGWSSYAQMLALLGPKDDGTWPRKALFALYNLELQRHVRVTRFALL